MGVIQPGDVSEQVLILKNISLFDIKFRIFLDSLKDQGLTMLNNYNYINNNYYVKCWRTTEMGACCSIVRPLLARWARTKRSNSRSSSLPTTPASSKTFFKCASLAKITTQVISHRLPSGQSAFSITFLRLRGICKVNQSHSVFQST